MSRRMIKKTTATLLPVPQTLTTPCLTWLYRDSIRVPWDPEWHLPHPSPCHHEVLATFPVRLLAAPPGLSKEPTLRPAALPWSCPSSPARHSVAAGLAGCPLLFSAFFITSISSQFSRFFARGSKMAHLGNGPSTAWARWWLAPVLTYVRAHKHWARIQAGLAFQPWLRLKGQASYTAHNSQQTSLVLDFLRKLQCDTMEYITSYTTIDTASLLLHWLLNSFFTSKENLSFSSWLLPSPQLFQNKCFLTGIFKFIIGSIHSLSLIFQMIVIEKLQNHHTEVM